MISSHIIIISIVFLLQPIYSYTAYRPFPYPRLDPSYQKFRVKTSSRICYTMNAHRNNHHISEKNEMNTTRPNTQQEEEGKEEVEDKWTTVCHNSKSKTFKNNQKHFKGKKNSSQKDIPSYTSKNKDPFVILLVGLPGSGKSTFAQALEKAAPHKYVRINQDALGNRKKCENLMRKTLRRNKCPIIDRCNFDQTQRDHFWKIAIEEKHYRYDDPERVVRVQGVECVIFTCKPTDCIERCEGRGNSHETIKPGNAKRVVYRMQKDLVLPNSTERPWRDVKRIQNYGINNMKAILQHYLEKK